MHELSIAEAILATVRREQEARGHTAITGIGVRIGALSGVLPEALRFGFEALLTGTPMAGCRLDLETIPLKGLCQTCSHAFPIEAYHFVCPACGDRQIQVTHGYELEIAYLEMEDPSAS